VATFLTTPAMNPALRARVERAVSPRARARHAARTFGIATNAFATGPRFHRAWIFPLALALVLGGFALLSYRAERRAIAAEKVALAAALEERRAALPAGHPGFVAMAAAWIRDAARDGDVADEFAADIKTRAALDAWLRRPGVYVNMTIAEARDPRRLAEATKASTKDAFLLCLMRPPESNSERDRLAKVRGVYFDGTKVDEETANVRRLAAAQIGLTAVGPIIEDAIATAEDLSTLRRLRRDLEAAPMADAARAASAELMIVVIDEPGSGRVLLADVGAHRVLMRLRGSVSEQGTTAAASLHREQLASCSLALAVRSAAEGGESH
jgi:hypothetical protein